LGGHSCGENEAEEKVGKDTSTSIPNEPANPQFWE
jgi:hypothetical protein